MEAAGAEKKKVCKKGPCVYPEAARGSACPPIPGPVRAPPFPAATGSFLYPESQAEALPNPPSQSSIPKICSSFGGEMGCVSRTSYTRRSLGKDSRKDGLETLLRRPTVSVASAVRCCATTGISAMISPCRRQVALGTAESRCFKCLPPAPPAPDICAFLPQSLWWASAISKLYRLLISFQTDSSSMFPKIEDHWTL